jgi:hypothetical protein
MQKIMGKGNKINANVGAGKKIAPVLPGRQNRCPMGKSL